MQTTIFFLITQDSSEVGSSVDTVRKVNHMFLLPIMAMSERILFGIPVFVSGAALKAQCDYEVHREATFRQTCQEGTEIFEGLPTTTVEPPNSGRVGDKHFVHYSEVGPSSR